MTLKKANETERLTNEDFMYLLLLGWAIFIIFGGIMVGLNEDSNQIASWGGVIIGIGIIYLFYKKIKEPIIKLRKQRNLQ